MEKETKSIRDNPELLAEFLALARSAVGEWSEDQILNTVGKVMSTSPDKLSSDISEVLFWCAMAQNHGTEADRAMVEVFQQDMPVKIYVSDNGVISVALDLP